MRHEDYHATLVHSFQGHYARNDDVWSSDPALRRIGRTALQRLKSPAARVLDVGTGRGHDASTFCDAGHFVTGIDLIETPEARKLASVHPERFRYLTGDVYDRRIEVGLYDLVLDNGCFHHQPGVRHHAYLMRLRELLRPEGLLVLSVFTRDEEDSPSKLWTAPDGRETHILCAADLAELLRGAGLEPTRARREERHDDNLKFYLVVEGRPTCD